MDKPDDIYLTEYSLQLLIKGNAVYNDNVIIHPPKTNELKLMELEN